MMMMMMWLSLYYANAWRRLCGCSDNTSLSAKNERFLRLFVGLLRFILTFRSNINHVPSSSDFVVDEEDGDCHYEMVLI